MAELDGKVALVTGAGRTEGLGRAIALDLARRGADVAVTDLLRTGPGYPAESVAANEAELESVTEEVRALGRRAVAVRCDVTVAAEVDQAVATVVDEFDRVDVLVNNAGVGYLMHPVVEFPEQEWDVTLDVNLKGPFLCARAVAHHMIERGGGGRIISIASQGGKSGFPHASAYCASKHGLIGLTRVLAIELGPHDITANCVCPNHVTTGLGSWQNKYFSQTLGVSMETYRQQMLDRIPLGRNCTQDDIARAVAWLAGPDAAYISGEAVNVSGGEEMH